jgi:hypothetical protein
MTFADPGDLGSGDVVTEAWVDQVRENFVSMLDFTSYTPTFTQSATVSKTVNHAFYIQFGFIVIGFVKMAATSAGTVSNAILGGLPTAHNLSINSPIGWGYFQDSGTDVKTGILVTAAAAGGTTAKIQRDAKADTLGTASDSVAVASGDILGYSFIYQAQ